MIKNWTKIINFQITSVLNFLIWLCYFELLDLELFISISKSNLLFKMIY